MVPDEPATVRAHARPAPRCSKAADRVAGRRRRRRDAPRLGQYRHHPGRREDQHAAGRLRARGRFPPARRHQPRRGAGEGRGDRRAPSPATASRLLPGSPEPTWLRSDARDDGPSPAPRRRGRSAIRRSRSSASAAPTPASGGAQGVPAFVYGCSPAGMGGVDESVSIAEFHHVMRVHALAAVRLPDGRAITSTPPQKVRTPLGILSQQASDHPASSATTTAAAINASGIKGVDVV